MGYNTDFSGQFYITPAVDDATAAILEAIHDDSKRAEKTYKLPKMPERAYCQWQMVETRDALEWDCGEKFYDYIQWAEYLQKLLADRGYKMTGEVDWQGEDTEDRGTIVAVDGKITTRPINDDVDQKEAFNTMLETLTWIRDNCTGLPAVARALADKAITKAQESK